MLCPVSWVWIHKWTVTKLRCQSPSLLNIKGLSVLPVLCPDHPYFQYKISISIKNYCSMHGQRYTSFAIWCLSCAEVLLLSARQNATCWLLSDASCITACITERQNPTSLLKFPVQSQLCITDQDHWRNGPSSLLLPKSVIFLVTVFSFPGNSHQLSIPCSTRQLVCKKSFLCSSVQKPQFMADLTTTNL